MNTRDNILFFDFSDKERCTQSLGKFNKFPRYIYIYIYIDIDIDIDMHIFSCGKAMETL